MNSQRKILISELIPECLGRILEQYGQIIKLPPYEKLRTPIATHGDILIFKDTKKSRLYFPKDYYLNNLRIFDFPHDWEMEFISEELGLDYPNDIYLDALLVGDALVCKEKYTAEKIKRNKRVIDVKQGYARCSVCLLDGASAITADIGIAKALRGLGVDVLQIDSGGIELPGYDCGFIGGASLVVDQRVIFFGNIEDHPNGGEILDFVTEKGFGAEYPKNYPLTDLGSAVVI